MESTKNSSDDTPSVTDQNNAPSTEFHHLVNCIVLGMAGSGKTTLVSKIVSYLNQQQLQEAGLASPSSSPSRAIPSYIINLDPAVATLNYSPNIDIRDTHPFRTIMDTYKLGPNGAILTALNLFSTHFHQVLDLIQKRGHSIQYTIIDTPGQIEAFTWSASGTIITESLAALAPTIMLYVVDTPRTMQGAATFVSNMMYACSILYRTRLPLVVVFNKIDVKSCDTVMQWMKDADVFQRYVEQNENSFAASLARSMAMALASFYDNVACVGVSASTGQGLDELFQHIQQARQDYIDTYYKELMERFQENQIKIQVQQEESLKAFAKDYKKGTPKANLASKIIAKQQKNQSSSDLLGEFRDSDEFDPEHDTEAVLNYGFVRPLRGLNNQDDDDDRAAKERAKLKPKPKPKRSLVKEYSGGDDPDPSSSMTRTRNVSEQEQDQQELQALLQFANQINVRDQDSSKST